MEYVYSVLILHTLGKEITEENIAKIITAAGAEPDTAKIKALISSLEGVNIGEAIKATAFAAAAPAAAPAQPAKEEKKEEKKKEEKKEEEEAMAGLGSLFG